MNGSVVWRRAAAINYPFVSVHIFHISTLTTHSFISPYLSSTRRHRRYGLALISLMHTVDFLCCDLSMKRSERCHGNIFRKCPGLSYRLQHHGWTTIHPSYILRSVRSCIHPYIAYRTSSIFVEIELQYQIISKYGIYISFSCGYSILDNLHNSITDFCIIVCERTSAKTLLHCPLHPV